MALSFFSAIRYTHKERQLLPPSFKDIVGSSGIHTGNIIVETQAGLSWTFTLDKTGDRFYFGGDWKRMLKQLKLHVMTILFFTYAGNNKFVMDFYSPIQQLQPGPSFYRFLISDKVDYVELPMNFYKKKAFW